MIKVENIDVWGFEHAIRGMRNPLNSWDKSDSKWVYDKEITTPIDNIDIDLYKYEIGENDSDLMKRLYKAGPEHRKYLRQIFVSLDITAPLYWWKEFDTYKVGTVANSCSTMHKIMSKPFELDDFSHEHLKDCESVGSNEFYDFPCGRRYTPTDCLIDTIKMLNFWRDKYLVAKKIDSVVEGDNDAVVSPAKTIWWQVIQLLPSSYNQKRTVTMDYENAVTMIRQRTGHKLDEWREFVEILSTLPYLDDICGGDK